MPLRGFRLWLLAFAGFFLMTAAWAVAVPYDASADEHDHIYRAAGIFAGDVAPAPAEAVRGSGAFVDVPRGLVRDAAAECWRFKPAVSAACAPGPGSDRTTVRVGTGAGRYHPVYYALVGVPLKLFPGWPGVYLARLIGGGLAAALLAAAVVTIVGYTRRRLMLGGMLVAVTPMALHFFAAVNPNGLEIAAGVGLVVGLVPVVLGRTDGVDGVPRGPLVLAGLSAIALASLRPTGLIYLAAVAVAFLVPVRRATFARLWGSRPARWWAVAIAGSALVAVAWAMLMKSTNLGSAFQMDRVLSRGQAIMWVGQHVGQLLNEMVGVFGWLDTTMPTPIYVLWQLAAGGLLVSGLAFGGWTDRWRLAAITGGGFVVPIALQTLLLNDTGFVTQGRYLLPGLVGLFVLSAWYMEQHGMPVAAGRSMTRLLLGVVLPLHLFSLLWAMMRWRSGTRSYGYIGVSSLNPFGKGWQPPVGAAVPLLLLLAGAAALAWLVWRASAVTGAAADNGATDESAGDDSAGDDSAAPSIPAERDASMTDPDASGIEAVSGSNRGLV